MVNVVFERFLGFMVLALSTVPAAATPVAPTDPYVIFGNARLAWENSRYPAQLAYDVVVTVDTNAPSVRHYHSYYDSTTDRVNVLAVSDEELAHPYTPHGINVSANVFGGRIPLSSPQQTFDFLGVPELAPNYSFGIADYIPHDATFQSDEVVREIRREFHDPARRTDRLHTDTGLKTIVSVASSRRNYTITLAGIVPANDHRDYDLRLVPVRDPSRYRLREVWINTTTFATDRAATQGNFTATGLADLPWTIAFADVGRAHYIESEKTSARFTLERRTYDGATVEFRNVRTATIPGTAALLEFATDPQTGMQPLTEPKT